MGDALAAADHDHSTQALSSLMQDSASSFQLQVFNFSFRLQARNYQLHQAGTHVSRRRAKRLTGAADALAPKTLPQQQYLGVCHIPAIILVPGYQQIVQQVPPLQLLPRQQQRASFLYQSVYYTV